MLTMNKMQSPHAIKVRDFLDFQRIDKNYRRGIITLRSAMDQVDLALQYVMFGPTDWHYVPTDKEQYEYRCAFRELCQHIGIADINGVVKIQL